MTEYSRKSFLNVLGVLQAWIGKLDKWLQTYWLHYVHEMDFM